MSSLVTYDFYRSYINPAATGKQLLRVSHLVVTGFGLLVASVAVGFCYAGFSVTFIVTAIGILIDGKSITSSLLTQANEHRRCHPQCMHTILEEAVQASRNSRAHNFLTC